MTRRGHKLEAQNNSYCFYKIKNSDPKSVFSFFLLRFLRCFWSWSNCELSSRRSSSIVSPQIRFELCKRHCRVGFVVSVFVAVLLFLGSDLRSMNLSNGKGSMSTLTASVVMKSGDAVSDQFPAGLRVLVVDDDPTCLMILEKMLRTCLYEGTTLLLLLTPSVSSIFCFSPISIRSLSLSIQVCFFLRFGRSVNCPSQQNNKTQKQNEKSKSNFIFYLRATCL